MMLIPWKTPSTTMPHSNKPMLIRYAAVDNEDGFGIITIMAISPPSLSPIILCIASLEWYDWEAHFKTSYNQATRAFAGDFELITMNAEMRMGCTSNFEDEPTVVPTLEVKGVDDRGYQMLTMNVATGDSETSLELWAKRGIAWTEKRSPFSKREKAELGEEDLRLGNGHWCERDGCEDGCQDSEMEDDTDESYEDKGTEDEDMDAEGEGDNGTEDEEDVDDDFEVMAEKKT
ncbi:MAG: hypothetical protein Q9184_004316 [Pyrenodesmia sp. 2 TL-2023]